MNGKQSILASRDKSPPSGRKAHTFKMRERVLGGESKRGGWAGKEST